MMEYMGGGTNPSPLIHHARARDNDNRDQLKEMGGEGLNVLNMVVIDVKGVQ